MQKRQGDDGSLVDRLKIGKGVGKKEEEGKGEEEKVRVRSSITSWIFEHTCGRVRKVGRGKERKEGEKKGKEKGGRL